MRAQFCGFIQNTATDQDHAHSKLRTYENENGTFSWVHCSIDTCKSWISAWLFNWMLTEQQWKSMNILNMIVACICNSPFPKIEDSNSFGSLDGCEFMYADN